MSSFAVDTKHLETLLNGSTIDQLINEKRLFIVNHELVKDLPCKEGVLVSNLPLFRGSGEGVVDVGVCVSTCRDGCMGVQYS